MVKSFKKVIASLLAILIVVCAMPFTAFAEYTGYTLDCKLLFNPVYVSGYFNYNEVEAGKSSFKYSMLQEAPLTYDYKMPDNKTVSGTLKLEAAKTQPLADEFGTDPLTEDRQLGVGDYFSVTVTFDNAYEVFAAMAQIAYSDNIEPAGFYVRETRKGNYEGLAGINDTNGQYITIGGKKAVDSNSAWEFYKGMDDNLIGNTSKINTTKQIMDSQNSAQSGGDRIYVNKITSDKVASGDIVLTDPETGEVGYTYDDTFIANTFIFKIIDEGNIEFSVYDTDDSKSGGFQGFGIAITKLESYIEYLVSYAVNNKKRTDGLENSGSRKITFYGKNVNTDGLYPEVQECDHANTHVENAKDATCTEPGYTGDTICDDCGETIETGTEIPALGHNYVATVTAPTCTEAGYTTYTCSRCQDTYTGDETPATGHSMGDWYTVTEATEDTVGEEKRDCANCDYSETREIPVLSHTHTWREDAEVPATCTQPGTAAGRTCTKCGATEGYEVIPATGHNWKEDAEVPATCTQPGTAAGKTCLTCGATEGYEVIPATGHNWKEDAEVPATCTQPGTAAGKTCLTCGAKEGYEVIPATGHNWKEDAEVPATCTEPGTAAGKTCLTCGAKEGYEVIPATGHNWREDAEVPATASQDGTAAGRTCLTCGAKEGYEVIPATGVVLTVDNKYADLGSTNYDFGANKVAYGEKVTITAEPAEGCEFVGFNVGNKLVSEDPTYSFIAYKDVTVTPVFQEKEKDTMSVIFYDKYNNVVAQYVGLTAEQYQAKIAQDGVPAGPIYPGYTFVSWSIPDEDILALNDSATISAVYQKAERAFTVTTDDSVELNINGGYENGQIPFDTRVTVSAPGATAWKINDTIVGYGESYSFYVGSDVDIRPVFDTVTANPTVSMVNYYQVDDTYKVSFIATMKVPDGFTLVDHGFVYGKDLTDADLTLEKVGTNGSVSGAGVVKSLSLGTSKAEQFALSYGVKAMNARACAKAYLTYKEGDQIKTVYSDTAIFRY